MRPRWCISSPLDVAAEIRLARNVPAPLCARVSTRAGVDRAEWARRGRTRRDSVPVRLRSWCGLRLSGCLRLDPGIAVALQFERQFVPTGHHDATLCHDV